MQAYSTAMLGLAVVVCALCACGRIDFGQPADSGPPPCFVDHFDGGAASDWVQASGAWATLPASGPDGSASFAVGTPLGLKSITNPRFHGLMSAHVALDFWIGNAATGDFDLNFTPVGAPVVVNTTPGYDVGMFPVGSDSEPDIIFVQLPKVQLASHNVSIAAATWHHVDVTLDLDGAIHVTLDGTAYMDAPADQTYSHPLDLHISFWGPGRVDNVVVDCVR